jgi:DNA-binding NarL/FixJ family response regulator
MATHVLIVDANRSAAHVTQAIVARPLPGATLTVVHTLEDAWRDLQGHRPDVLLLDPARDQLAATRLIQYAMEECRHVRVVVLASAPTLTLRRTMQALGVEIYLEKPALLERLAQALQTPPRPSPV